MSMLVKVATWIIGGFVLFMVIGLTLDKAQMSSGNNVYSEKQKWDNAASECWKAQDRKSLNPYEKANVASFCEGLEQRARESR